MTLMCIEQKIGKYWGGGKFQCMATLHRNGVAIKSLVILVGQFFIGIDCAIL